MSRRSRDSFPLCPLPNGRSACGRPVLAGGMCAAHYNRARQSDGDPLVHIPLRKHPASIPSQEELRLRHEAALARKRSTYAADLEGGRRRNRANYSREWHQRRYAATREEQIERAKAWGRAHPEKRREAARISGHKRRAKKRGVAAEHFQDVEIFERDGWECRIAACCCPDGRSISPEAPSRSPWSASLDHVTPLSKNGTHTRANVQASHLRCNLRKHTTEEGEG